RHVGEPFAFDGKDRLAQHEYRQENKRDPHARERQLRSQGRVSFAAIKPDDECNTAQDREYQDPLRPGLLEANLGIDPPAAPGEGSTKTLGQSVQQPINHVLPALKLSNILTSQRRESAVQ